MMKCAQIKATQKIGKNPLVTPISKPNQTVAFQYLEQGEMNEQHLPLSNCRV